MLEAPLVDATENILAQAIPILVEVVAAHLASLREFRILSYAFTSATAILSAKL
jgi:hypothetical protein